MKKISYFIHNHVDGKKTFVFCVLSIVLVWLMSFTWEVKTLSTIYLILEILKRHTEHKKSKGVF